MRLAKFAVLGTMPLFVWADQAPKYCEPSPEVRQQLKRTELRDLKGEERIAEQKKMLDELAAQSPDEFFFQLRYQSIALWRTEPARKALIARYEALEREHPEDPRYQFLYAKALVDTDTPRAIDIAKKILDSDPQFAPARVLLADIFSWGKFADRQKTRHELAAFFESCPGALNDKVLSLAQRYGDQELASKIAPQLRERLSRETDPELLRNWKAVWNLEFKARPVKEHDEVRKQIAADLQRLQGLRVQADAAWLLFLKNGYELAGNEGASKSTEQELLAKYPSSDEAQEISYEQWRKQHPWPGNDEAKQKEYWRASLQWAEARLKESPHNEMYLEERFSALSNLDDAPVDQLTAAADAFLAEVHKRRDFWSVPPFEMQLAQAYVKRKIHLDQVPGLVQEAWKNFQEQQGAVSDRDSEDYQKMRAQANASVTREAADRLLDVAKQLNKPEIAREGVAKVEALKPEKPYEKSWQWQIEAKWAELQGRKLDALLMYRAALNARPADSKPPGKDELAENVSRLWKELGGTEASRALLEAKPAATETAQQGNWEKPDKPIKPWQLTDLDGKTWKLTSLEGKVVLINVWASWCGPCKAEHPHLQKLYDRLKSDPSVQIVTFNVDDEVGKVSPYIKENHYTFPVLLAKDYVDELIPSLGIPQNWIVDPRGKWQWQAVGFGEQGNWEDEMAARMKATK